MVRLATTILLMASVMSIGLLGTHGLLNGEKMASLSYVWMGQDRKSCHRDYARLINLQLGRF